MMNESVVKRECGTKDKRKIQSVHRLLDDHTNGLCSVCGEAPVQIKKHRLCLYCYYRSRRGITVPGKANKGMNAKEALFAKTFFKAEDEWIFHPATFRINGANYTPDFYDKNRGVFIEVAGSRQAFCFNRLKYEKFMEVYPDIRFEVRNTQGRLIDIKPGRISWMTTIEKNSFKGLAALERVNPYHSPNDYLRGSNNPLSKLTEDQVRAIRSDRRSSGKISEEYGVSQVTVWKIRNRKIWTWLDDEDDFTPAVRQTVGTRA